MFEIHEILSNKPHKRCKMCRKELPIENFKIIRDDGLRRPRCQPCHIEYTHRRKGTWEKYQKEKAYKEELYLLQKEGKRRCRICDEVKILDEFTTNKTTHNGILKYPHGKTTHCSKCSWSKWGKPWSQLPENKEKLSVASSKWREKESSKEWIRKRHSYRYHNDPEYKVKHLLRVRLNKALNRKKQSQSFTRELGCTFSELVVHLESQFFPDPKTGEIMTWDNHGQDGWHIDHIKPLHEFDLLDDVQLKQAAHYTNLQPLWWWQNLEKKDKYIP